MFMPMRSLAAAALRSALPVVVLAAAVVAFFLYGACGCAGDVGDVAAPADELGADLSDASTDLPGRDLRIPAVLADADAGVGDAVVADAADAPGVLVDDTLPSSSDAASPDAGSSTDTSSPPDTGSSTDTSSTPDAAPAPDTATAPDVRDAGAPDACPTHHNGSAAPLGQAYRDCSPLGVPGDAATYDLAMADEAAAAWPESGPTIAATCGSGAPGCVSKVGAGTCATWCYAGPLAGRVYVAASCLCPMTTDPTWN